MPTPPALSKEQRRDAYVKALELRRQRAAIRTGLKNRDFTMGLVWMSSGAQGMKVYDLLVCLPGVGRARALAILETAGIAEKKTVRSCGPKQTARLFAHLRT